jgi:hypothetical protein
MYSKIRRVDSLDNHSNSVGDIDGTDRLVRLCALDGNGRPVVIAGASQDSYGAVQGTPREVLKQQGYQAALDKLDRSTWPDLYDWSVKMHEAIFRYFFRYPYDLRGLTRSFCAAVRGAWSSSLRNGTIPSAWDERQSESGDFLLEYDATFNEAMQYGREESLAARVEGLDSVSFAKTLSPAISWDGMTLTDPRDGEKKTFRPGELHLTDDSWLQEKIGTAVSRAELINHWNLTFAP